MSRPEVVSQSSLEQKNIPGFHGFELMKAKVDVLKEGAFAQFMQKVIEYRSDPLKIEQLRKEFSSYGKKRDIVALRAGGLSNDSVIDGPARLFAFFGEKVDFERDGMRVKFDFHGMNFAKNYIGAGHLLPGTVARIENKNGDTSERRPGIRGAEYRLAKNHRYQPIYNNTEIFIRYQDIFPDSVDVLRERVKIEASFMKQHVQLRSETQKRLVEAVPIPPPPLVSPLESRPEPTSQKVQSRLESRVESREVYHPSDVLVFGDSQIGGVRGYLKKGVRSYCRDGATISQIFDIVRDHPEQIQHAKLIYVQGGGNDVWATKTEKMKKNIQALVDYIRAVNPAVRLVIGTIPPREEVIVQKNSVRAEKIRQCLNGYNDWVRNRYEVFDVNRIMAAGPKSSSQNPEYRRNGAPNVHFNGKGYKAYAQAFESQFGIGVG